MKMVYWIPVIAAVFHGVSTSWGNVIFSQDFSTSTSVSAYVNSSNPDSGQWNAISRGSIADGGLSFTRGSSVGSFTRSTDLASAPQAVIYRFSVSVIGPTSRTKNAAVWQVGSAFSPTTSSRESSTKVHSQFAIDFEDSSGGYSFSNPTTGVDYTGTSFSKKFSITWVINNSGEALQYTAPNNSTRTVENDQWDLWCGSKPVFLGEESTTESRPLTDLKFAFTAGSGTIWMDDFSIETVPAVPEPAATGALAAAFLAVFAIVSKVRTKFRT